LASNEIDENDSHNEKQDEARTSTVCGMMIDLRAEWENARDSIRFSTELDSNEIDASDLH
jgi:hypothetical protein